MDANSNNTAPTTAQTLGQQLRDAREARGMSLGEVEERLKLSVKQLQAIEQGDYSLLPGATFARGFVRNYARLLELDAGQVQKTLDVCIPLDAPSAKLVELPPQPAKPAFALPLTLLILLAIAGFWFFSSSSSTPNTAPAAAVEASAPVPVAEIPVTASATALAASATALAASATALAASAPLAANVAASATLPAIPAPAVPVAPPAPAIPAKVASSVAAVIASAPVAAKIATAGVIRVQSSGSSWVSVVDADGKKLVFETLAANAAKEVQGKAPFKLTIGNASQVTLHYQGQAVDLAANIRGTTAKLELN